MQSVPSSKLAGPPVLVVDDDDMVRRAVVRVLRRKYTVTELKDAESALELIKSGAWFDAILCDLHLDGMSGRDLLSTLDAEYTEQAKRLVILSGSPRSALDEDFLDAINTRFLEKPASMAAIDALLADLVGERARAA